MIEKLKLGLVFFLFLLVPGVFAQTTNQGGDIVLAATIVSPLVLGIFFLIGAATLGDDHHVLKITLFLLSIPTFFISLWFSMVTLVQMYPGFETLQEAIATTTFWVAVIYFVFIAYFFLYAFFKTKDFFEKKKQERQSLEY